MAMFGYANMIKKFSHFLPIYQNISELLITQPKIAKCKRIQLSINSCLQFLSNITRNLIHIYNHIHEKNQQSSVDIASLNSQTVLKEVLRLRLSHMVYDYRHQAPLSQFEGFNQPILKLTLRQSLIIPYYNDKNFPCPKLDSALACHSIKCLVPLRVVDSTSTVVPSS